MRNYRRNFVPGGSYFFTVNLAERKSRLLTDHIDCLQSGAPHQVAGKLKMR
jgi:putative transposase